METVAEIKTMMEKVEYCLRNFPQTRNSDTYLTWKVWREFYGIDNEVSWNRYRDMPSQDDIKRARARIQNTLKQYPPTVKCIALHRRWNEQVWLKALGYKIPEEMNMTEEEYNATISE